MPRPLLRTAVSCAVWLAALAPAVAAPGDLDRSFGQGGGFSFNVSEPDPTPVFTGRAVALPGGDALAAVQTNAGGRGVFGLVRIGANGLVDPTFGRGGLVATPVGVDRAFAVGIARQPDGKIVVAGTAADPFGPLVALARYGEDGRLDPTFGSGGIVTFRPGADGAQYRPAPAVAVGPNGTIVTGGEVTDDLGQARWLLARLTRNGRLDTGFGHGGIATLTFPGASGPTAGEIDDLLVQADGRVVGIGTVSVHLALARLRANGTLDPSFGSGGLVPAPPLGGSGSRGGSIVPGPNGTYLVAGTRLSASGDQFLLGRFTAAGALDTTFGGAGTGFIAYQARGHASEGAGLVVLGDGSILIAGTAADVTGRLFLTIEKHRPNGTFDPTFLMGFGYLDDPSGTSVGSFATAIVVHGGLPTVVGEALNPRRVATTRIDAAGTFVAHGTATIGGTLGSSMARVAGVAAGADAATTVLAPTNEGTKLLRLRPNGTLDPAFGTRGVADMPVTALSALALAPAGRIVVGGASPPAALVVLRRLRDGANDAGFGTNGRALLNVPGATNVTLGSLAVDPAGRIVLAGSAVMANVEHCLIARLLPGGAPDGGFGSAGVALSTAGIGCRLTDVVRTPSGGYAAAGTVRESATVTRAAAFAFRGDGSRSAAFVLDAGHAAPERAAGFDVAAQRDGRILLVARVGTGLGTHLVVVRFTPALVLDHTFSGDGIASATLPGRITVGEAVQVTPEGRIVVEGAAGLTSLRLLVARFRSNGAPDTGFARRGVEITPAFASNVGGFGSALLPDGRLVVAQATELNTAGVFRFLGDVPRVAAPRVTATGERAATFRATVTARGLAGVRFAVEYGLTRRYGKRSPLVAVPARLAPLRVLARLRGLDGGRRYHYRLLALGASGAGATADATFRTPAIRPRARLRIPSAPASVAAWRTIRGRAVDPRPSSGILRVDVNLVRRVGRRCAAYDGTRFVAMRCARAVRVFVHARGTRTFALRVRGLRAGTYDLRVRAVDRAHVVERRFVTGVNRLHLVLT